MDQDMVFWGVIVTLIGTVGVIGYLFYMLYKKANENSSK